MRSVKFWADAVERAVKTAAQTAVALLGSAQVNVLDADWKQTAAVAAGAAVVSVLTSISSSRVGADDSASLVS